ncbi:DUF2489 domain-containing protein [Corallincola platygyrae]|uniref:DUF2489 domain-containing protein n=1 Tax=Corallincola platygyrae TaxID=1193278 RepID=A0ABW4XKE5_9GAMM
MTSMWWAAIAVGALIIVGLSVYAGRLLYLLKQQQQAQRLVAERKNARLLESIYTISMAAEQGQCELSEAAIRICVLLDHLQPSVGPIDFTARYPNLHGLYDKVKHLPTHDARKKYKRNEIMKMDLQRMKDEESFAEGIQPELLAIRSLTKELCLSRG